MKFNFIKTTIHYQILLASLFALLTSSCGGSSKEAKDGMKVLEGVKDIVSNAENMSERQEELKSIEPLNEDDYFNWAPDEVMSLPIKESTERHLPFDKYRYSGYAASYKGNDKSVRLEVFDCAGSTIYSRYAGMLSTNAMSQERENYYEKNVERDGTIVYEWYDSKRNDCNLMFITNDRFVVTIKGEGFSPDEIWENIDDFNLDDLN